MKPKAHGGALCMTSVMHGRVGRSVEGSLPLVSLNIMLHIFSVSFLV
jgi:hypothetical protein